MATCYTSTAYKSLCFAYHSGLRIIWNQPLLCIPKGLCAACDCSVLTGDLTGFRLEPGFHWDGSSAAQEAKNIVPFPSELFCVVCLRLGWVILKEIKRNALHVAGRYKHKANNRRSLFSNTQAAQCSEVSKLCYILEYLRAFKNPTSQFTPKSSEVTLTGGESQTDFLRIPGDSSRVQ